MGRHAKLSPSSAHRWLNCPGSIRMCEGIPDEPNEHSMKGSIAHCLGETCLIRGHLPSDYLGYWGWDNGKGGNGVQEVKPDSRLPMVIKIDEAMVENVTLYVNTVRATRLDMPSAKFAVEQKLDLTWLVPDMFGTADHVAIEFMGKAVIDDYKNGFMVVEVEDNPQFMVYALGAIGEGNPNMVEEVVMRVVQPNGIHHLGPVRSHNISVEELMDWGLNVLKPGALEALKPDAPVHAGAWCKWCGAKRTMVCSEHRKFVFNAVDVMFDKEIVPVDTPTLMSPVEMTGEQLDKILKVSGVISDWVKTVESEAEKRLAAGASNSPKGVKLVLGRKSYKWAKADAEIARIVSAYIGTDKAYTKKLKTVAQMKKTFKELDYKKVDLEYLIKVSQGRKVVPVSDKRPAIICGADAMFKKEK